MISPSVHDAFVDDPFLPTLENPRPGSSPNFVGDLEHPPGGPRVYPLTGKDLDRFYSDKVEDHLRFLYAPAEGRVVKKFDDDRFGRAWQAGAILRRNGIWPPREGQIFVIQIDQDAPPPPPRYPMGPMPAALFQERAAAWKSALGTLHGYLTSYTGQTVIFRAERSRGRMELRELNPNGAFRSSSHAGQLVGDVSCNGRICGMAWLRSGTYPYRGKNGGGVYNPVDDTLMRVARDINGNGGIDSDESERSQNAHGFAIQIHAGFHGSPKSTGCQNMPPGDFQSFQKLIDGQNIESFTYVLIRRPHDIQGENVW